MSSLWNHIERNDMNHLSLISNHRAYSQLSDEVHETIYYKYHIECLDERL